MCDTGLSHLLGACDRVELQSTTRPRSAPPHALSLTQTSLWCGSRLGQMDPLASSAAPEAVVGAVWLEPPSCASAAGAPVTPPEKLMDGCLCCSAADTPMGRDRGPKTA
jgi:hypothetical protein